VLDVSEDSVRFLSGLLDTERLRRRTRTDTRALTTEQQALLVLRWFLDDTRMIQLARDNGIGRSTAYAYRDEAITARPTCSESRSRRPTVPPSPPTSRPTTPSTAPCAPSGNAPTPCSRPPSRCCAATAAAPGASATSSPPRSSCYTSSTNAPPDPTPEDHTT
jgi:hypothetical protein